MLYHPYVNVSVVLLFALSGYIGVATGLFSRYVRTGQSGNCADSAVTFRMTVSSEIVCSFKCKMNRDCKNFDYHVGSKTCIACNDTCGDAIISDGDLDGQCWESSDDYITTSAMQTTSTETGSEDFITTTVIQMTSTQSGSEESSITTAIQITSIAAGSTDSITTTTIQTTSTESGTGGSALTTDIKTTSTEAGSKDSMTTTAIRSTSTDTEDLKYLRDCLDCARTYNLSVDGLYRIEPKDGQVFDVFCLNSLREFGAGWTVFLRRTNESLHFTRFFSEYERGFGDVSGSHWAGLEFLHMITSGREQDVLMILVSQSLVGYETLSNFKVRTAPNYTMSTGELIHLNYTNSHIPCFQYSNNSAFSTLDRDLSESDCSRDYGRSGWWWNRFCVQFNPTGKYSNKNEGDFHPTLMNCLSFNENSEPLIEVIIALRRKY